MEEICHLCREINLTSLQAYHHAKSLDAPLQRRRDQFHADCSLCRLFLGRFPNVNEGKPLVGISIQAVRQRDWTKSASTFLRRAAVQTSSFLPKLGYTQYYPVSRITLGGQYQDFVNEWKRDVRVFVDATSSCEQRSHVAGRPILPPGCGQSMQAIASWLDECQLKHNKCRKSLSGTIHENERSSGTVLPTRSINIGLQNHNADVVDHTSVPVFVETTEGRRGRYAALSYCWGPTLPTRQPLMLKKENMSQLQRSVTVSHLPKTIQDAIAVTRQLNIPYLWVDRLCIVQDDVADWEEQAKKMCDIYEGSCITISAFGADGGDDGLFLPREDAPTVRIPCATSTRVMGDMSVAYPCGPSDPRFEGCSTFEAELRINAWNSRGWVMQERLLSRRIVHFGKFQLYWECQETSKNEDGTDDGSDRVWSYHGYQSKAIFHVNCSTHWLEKMDFLPGLRNPMDIWESLVRDYTGRQLSVASDKLQAIDGIAIAVQKRLGLGEYCCGMWSDGLHRLLLWYPANDLRPVQELHLPSWSWARSDGRVEFFNSHWKSSIRDARFDPGGSPTPSKSTPSRLSDALDVSGSLFSIDWLPQPSQDHCNKLLDAVRDHLKINEKNSLVPEFFWSMTHGGRGMYGEALYTFTVKDTVCGVLRFDSVETRPQRAFGLVVGEESNAMHRLPIEKVLPGRVYRHIVLEEMPGGSSSAHKRRFRRVGVGVAVWIQGIGFGLPLHRESITNIRIE